MSRLGTYRLNPAPAFVMHIANPKRGKKKKSRRLKNPSGRGRGGIFVVRKPKRNPRPKKRSHKKRAKKKNPFQLKHVLIENPAPKKRKHKKRRKNSVRKKKYTSTRRPNPMSKSKRKHKKSSSRKRNPRRSRSRSRMRRMRNPMGAIKEIFNPDMLIVAASAIATNVGTNMIMNRLVVGDATGARPFNLPGVDYTVPAATFYQKNGYILAFYKLGLGAVVGYMLRNQSARVSQGVLLGSTITAGSDIFKTAGLINAQGTLGNLSMLGVTGVSRNFRSGAGAPWPPMSNGAIYNNPALSMIQSGNVPRPRGMGAPVGPGTMADLKRQGGGAFNGAN